MPDVVELVAVLWLMIGTGALFYFTPVSVLSKFVRIVTCVGVGLFAAVLSLRTGIACGKAGAFLTIALPYGPEWVLRYPYSYLLDGLLRIIGPGSMVVATIGPIIYAITTRAGIRKRPVM